MAKCPLKTWDLIARRQYARFTGPAVVGTGGFPWVLAIPQGLGGLAQPSTVPLTQYWIVWLCSILSGKPSTQNISLGASVILLQNGSSFPRIAPGTTGDDPFFLNYNNFGSREYGPTAYGLRIDKYHLTGEWDSFGSSASGEASMFKRPFLVGPGETLLGYECQYGTPSNPGTRMEMRLCYSAFDQHEEIELAF